MKKHLLTIASVLGLLVMVAALVGLFKIDALLSREPIAIALQLFAVALMLWARVTFGRRSFHAAANPTAGGLVMTGPYRFIRHPIYTAACLIGWGAVVTHWSLLSVTFGVTLIAGGLVRMLCEERLLTERYPEYISYAKTTKRMIPFVF